MKVRKQLVEKFESAQKTGKKIYEYDALQLKYRIIWNSVFVSENVSISQGFFLYYKESLRFIYKPRT